MGFGRGAGSPGLTGTASGIGSQSGALPGYAGWDHYHVGLWPTPTDGGQDYNTCPEPEWADCVATAVRERLRAWWDGNLVWDGCDLLAVHDWDSVICQPEPAIAGNAAAFLGLGGRQGHATVEQSATFLDTYVEARGLQWDTADREVAWAAGLWVRAFDAKEAAALHGDPDDVLTQPEARARLELAGLNPDLVKGVTGRQRTEVVTETVYRKSCGRSSHVALERWMSSSNPRPRTTR